MDESVCGTGELYVCGKSVKVGDENDNNELTCDYAKCERRGRFDLCRSSTACRKLMNPASVMIYSI